jgi:uncharacterized DUF497 family protein
MKIVWDEPKRIANIAKHRLDFATLTEEFFANAKVLSAKSGRYQAIGMDINGLISVVFVVLGLEDASCFEEGKKALQCQKLKRNLPTQKQT